MCLDAADSPSAAARGTNRRCTCADGAYRNVHVDMRVPHEQNEIVQCLSFRHRRKCSGTLSGFVKY
jgi:hypothetical protein